MTLFDFTKEYVSVDKPIRLIECFGGIGSQAMALRDLGVDFEHYRLYEIDPFAVKSYNAIHETQFEPTDITTVSGNDLGIRDTDKYTYLFTYSFPCQDISLAGNRKGFAKDSGTRSALIWEIERLLEETETLPQILLMENVTAVHGEGNRKHFAKWIDYLSNKGYTNFAGDLNAKQYGVAQNRDRCFVISLLGDYNYHFPDTMPLTKIMGDYLDDVVDENFYIKSEKARNLLLQLAEDGKLDRGGYDKQLTCQSTDRKQEKSQTAYVEGQIEESVNDLQKEQALLNIMEVGFIDKGTGQHQSNTVYGKQGVSPCLSAVNYKAPIKVVADGQDYSGRSSAE